MRSLVRLLIVLFVGAVLVFGWSNTTGWMKERAERGTIGKIRDEAERHSEDRGGTEVTGKDMDAAVKKYVPVKDFRTEEQEQSMFLVSYKNQQWCLVFPTSKRPKEDAGIYRPDRNGRCTSPKS